MNTKSRVQPITGRHWTHCPQGTYITGGQMQWIWLDTSRSDFIEANKSKVQTIRNWHSAMQSLLSEIVHSEFRGI